MLERDIERYLYEEVKKLGGIAYKFTSPGRRSVPDRICVLPGGVVCFVECKSPGKKPTPAQQREITSLTSRGHLVTYVDSKDKIDKLIFKLKSLIDNTCLWNRSDINPLRDFKLEEETDE